MNTIVLFSHLHSTLKYLKNDTTGIPWSMSNKINVTTQFSSRENLLLPWWMMPFSRRAWPRLIPSSALLISPLSKSHETNSLRTHRDNSCVSLHITQCCTHDKEGIYEPLVKGTWIHSILQSDWSRLVKSSPRTQIKMISSCIPPSEGLKSSNITSRVHILL